MKHFSRAALAALFALVSCQALAQSNAPSPGGASVPYAVSACLNSSAFAVPWFNSAGTWQCAGATVPVSGTVTPTGAGANNADGVASVATGLQSAAVYSYLYNGTTWDRARGDTTAGLWAQIKAALPAGTNAIGTVLLPTAATIAAGNGVVSVPSSEAGAGIAPVVSSALESNHVIKASAGNFYSGYVTTGATAGWLLLANSTTAPTAGGAAIAPLACVLAPANQTTSIAGPVGAPLVFSTGITMVFSTSGCLTNTASTSAFFSGMAK
jgi:hypothetical protein